MCCVNDCLWAVVWSHKVHAYDFFLFPDLSAFFFVGSKKDNGSDEIEGSGALSSCNACALAAIMTCATKAWRSSFGIADVSNDSLESVCSFFTFVALKLSSDF